MQFSYVIPFGSLKGPILRKFVFSSNPVEEVRINEYAYWSYLITDPLRCSGENETGA